jgi:hypothetical protein
MNSILRNEKRQTFVPVFTKKRGQFKHLPSGLMAYKGLDINDPFMVTKVTQMFKGDSHQRAKDIIIKMQEKEKLNWLDCEMANDDKRRNVDEQLQSPGTLNDVD